jgi:serine/threonine protein kinase
MVSLPSGGELGRYQIQERIGIGGMASVHRAHDPTLNRDIAIKVLPSYEAEDPTFSAILKNLDLDAWRQPCVSPNPTKYPAAPPTRRSTGTEVVYEAGPPISTQNPACAPKTTWSCIRQAR